MDKEACAFPFWSASAEETAAHLTTDLARGLSGEEATARQATFGSNEFAANERNTPLAIFLRQFASPLIFILLIAGVVTLVLTEWLDAGIIFLAIGVNALLGFFQEYKAETALARLRSYIQVRTRVVRGGREQEIDAHDLVPGDLVHLTRGSRVPADLRLVSITNLRIDESLLTGEALPVEKGTGAVRRDALVADRRSMAFGGTLVSEGSGVGVVTATGTLTEFGKIATLVSDTDSEQTPIQKAVTKLAWFIATGLLVLVAGVFLLGIARGEPVLDMFLVAVAVAVGAIPEALPVGLAAALALGAERLAKRKGIMRSLTAAETLGSTTVVLTDKTGTLTEADLKLVSILPERSRSSDTRTTAPLARFSALQRDVLALAAMSTDVLIENPDDPPTRWRMSGSPLEATIVQSAALHGVAHDHHAQIVVPFDSTHKFSASEALVSLETDLLGARRGRVRAVLGAPDVLIARSTLSAARREELLALVAEESRKGKRVLGVAASVVLGEHTGQLDQRELTGLTFVGLLAFFDPVRTEVPDAIRRIEGYGVRVVMATGDLPGTAVAVAEELGWTVRADEIITGEDMRDMDDVQLSRVLAKVKVCARVTPQDKLRIARLFQRRGETVAMTGDGVNDAPSLKAVDIGIAVGSGSDVAKGVADLVLLDDNFDTIVAAIEEGKRVLRNIRKTFVYLMSSSADEVVLIGGSLLLGLALPLSAVQIIWVNLFTSGLPAIAFAFDRDTGTRTKRIDRHVLNGEVKALTFGIGVASSLLLFALYAGLMQFDLPHETVRTFVFACFASYILFVAFSFRNLERPLFAYAPFENRFLVFGVVVGVTLLAATVYVPFLQGIFDTVSLSAVWLGFLVLWIVLNVALVEATKWVFYRKG